VPSTDPRPAPVALARVSCAGPSVDLDSTAIPSHESSDCAASRQDETYILMQVAAATFWFCDEALKKQESAISSSRYIYPH